MKTLKIKAKKQFGQNFLQDENIIEKIIEVIIPKNKKIIEIGPGQGAITKHLLQKCTQLTAFEIDKDMINILNNKFQNAQNFNLIHQDFLDSDLSSYKEYMVVGNIPYNITTDIIFKLFEYRYTFKKVILMVQKEYAQRLIAKVNSTNYSKLTITANYLAKVKLEFLVHKQSFVPVPKVDSAIVSFDFYQDKNDNYDKLKDFFKLCFLFKRKFLLNSLATKYNKQKILDTFKTLNISNKIRIQELSIEQIIDIFNTLNK